MALSVEEILQLAVERFKSKIDEAVETRLAPFVLELDKRIEEIRAQGHTLASQKRRDEPLEAEVVEIKKR